MIDDPEPRPLGPKPPSGPGCGTARRVQQVRHGIRGSGPCGCDPCCTGRGLARTLLVTAFFTGLPALAWSATPPGAASADQAIECLALAIAYEAGGEPVEGQQAVAEVVLNRVRSPDYPDTVCGVVFAGATRSTGCQFTFTCDGSLRRRLPHDVLAEARKLAAAALRGQLPSRLAGATHFHAASIYPYWAPSLVRVRQIGAHVFYRQPRAPALPAPAIAMAPAAPGFAPWGLTLPAPR